MFVPLCKHCPELSVSLMKCNVILCPSCSSGSLIQLPSVERGKLSKVRLGSLSLKKEGERQCFLFTKHFLVCTRSSGGKLHLLKVRTPRPQSFRSQSGNSLFNWLQHLIFAVKLLQQGGVLSLIDCTLIEEPDASDEECKFATSMKQCAHNGRHTGSSYWLI